jgi:hypothetical protein
MRGSVAKLNRRNAAARVSTTRSMASTLPKGFGNARGLRASTSGSLSYGGRSVGKGTAKAIAFKRVSRERAANRKQYLAKGTKRSSRFTRAALGALPL